MYESGCKIKLSNVEFIENNSCEIQLLELLNSKKTNLCTIVFGRNGSGKSTLCKSINTLINKKEELKYGVELFDVNGVTYDKEKLENIRIFSEFFIDENIRFKDSGLDTIILLGEDVKIDDEIEKNVSLLKVINESLMDCDLSIFDDVKNSRNPQFNMSKMIKTLKQSDNWAYRRKEINDLKNNAPVNENVVFDIINNHSNKITLAEFNKCLSNYKLIKENNEICNYRFCSLNDADLNGIIEVLNTKIKKKSDDDIAKEIYKVISTYGGSRISEIKHKLEEDIDICPYCFQIISKEHKAKVIESIKNILSKESDELKEKIKSLYLTKFEYLEVPNIINDKVRLELNNASNIYNNEVELINNHLNKKYEDIYSCIELMGSNYEEAYNRLLNVIDIIENEINNHNINVKRIANLKADLHKYNNYLAWESIKDEYNEYKKNIDFKSKLEIKFNDLHKQLTQTQEKITELRMRKNKTEIAIKDINDSLSFIFLSKDRLQIVADKDTYRVISKGQSVRLEDLSTGERNIIALCYFFTYIGNGKGVEKRFNDEYLIFIDDPITSFDHENQIGIYGFIRKMIKKVLTGNFNSRFAFLTHSYEVAYNLDKITNDVGADITGVKKSINVGRKLENFKISECNISDGRNQYNVLLNNVYDYSNNPLSKVSDEVIGNMIRKMLEMFASFVFNTNFERLNYKISSNNLYDLLNNYMFRILVHNESHSMIDAYAYDQIDRFETFTHDEKVKTAKLSLLLIENLATTHLESYLGSEMKTIFKWKEEFSHLF